MSVQGLKALTDKYGRWTLERCELQEREAKAELEEASKRFVCEAASPDDQRND